MCKKSVFGLISLCLLILSGCGSARPREVPQITLNQCPPVVPCVMQAASPRTNGELNLVLEQTEADWALCAAQVDMIYNCQQKAATDAQARRDP
ncbi:Rz1-like lysis system protein LysC [Pusillimonas sp. NJUB218]|uniref:Rz1-like lysis system protein LysC n=1 Tax=Pusillimonas sp. NJUB218 TaxID=2023230 RepID=UPI000F4CE6C4|nr:Rz1-like lysis system protein LysC [Pusillimonas sp. NJUB218]ROT46073.1 hypothetical protein CHR62_03600 [Pusillimonas sp. NJUB218]